MGHTNVTKTKNKIHPKDYYYVFMRKNTFGDALKCACNGSKIEWIYLSLVVGCVLMRISLVSKHHAPYGHSFRSFAFIFYTAVLNLRSTVFRSDNNRQWHSNYSMSVCTVNAIKCHSMIIAFSWESKHKYQLK